MPAWLGWGEILIILAVGIVLVLTGSLPAVAASLGKGLGIYRSTRRKVDGGLRRVVGDVLDEDP